MFNSQFGIEKKRVSVRRIAERTSAGLQSDCNFCGNFLFCRLFLCAERFIVSGKESLRGVVMRNLLPVICGILLAAVCVCAEEQEGKRPFGRAAVLRTVLASGNSTRSVSADFNALIQRHLGEQKIRMTGLDAVEAFFRKHPYPEGAAEPQSYVGIGNALQADYLLVPRIDQFDVKNAVVLIEPGSKALLRRIGIFSGSLTVIDAESGKRAAVFPFSEKTDFSAIPEDTGDWNILQYYDYMMKKAASKLSASVGAWLRSHLTE